MNIQNTQNQHKQLMRDYDKNLELIKKGEKCPR